MKQALGSSSVWMPAAANHFVETGSRLGRSPLTTSRVFASPLTLHPSRFPISIHMRNTPNRVGSIGAFAAIASPCASLWRVSRGAMMPSSHSLAVA
jgi:hypothetical protein